MPATASRLKLTHKLQRLKYKQDKLRLTSNKRYCIQFVYKNTITCIFFTIFKSYKQLLKIIQRLFALISRVSQKLLSINLPQFRFTMNTRVYNNTIKTDVLLCYSGILGLQWNFDNFNPLYFQHDGASSHYTAVVQNYHYEFFQRKVIGCWGAIEMPPRSSDLTLPMDSFLRVLSKTKFMLQIHKQLKN